MADEYSLNQSLASEDADFIMQNRQFSWVPDSNAGSYQSQVVWELSSLANSGKYFDAKNSYLVLPLVMTLASTAGNIKNSTLENAFACSLKNGYTNLINSMLIEVTNNAVVSTMSYSGAYINYKLATTMSTDDVENLAPSIGFAKDTALAINYQGASSAIGLGECNNIIAPTMFNPTAGYAKSSYTQNKGRLARMEQTSYDPASTGESVASIIASGKNYVQKDGLGAGGVSVSHNILANIPLTLLSDFFAKLGLVKGAYIRLTLNLNVNCTSTMSINGAGQFTSVSTSSINGVVPYMISPIGAGQGLDIGGTTQSTGLQLSIGIAKNSINATGNTFVHPTLTSCRMYACMLDMCPATEQMYLSKCPTQKIDYEDFLSFQTLNVAPGASFSQILTNAVARAKRLIGIPSISSTANFAGTAGTIAPAASPFSSAPCTTSKQPLGQLNVLMSGANVYQQNLQYSWEQFLQETRKVNSINGGSSLGLSSGLINQTDFEAGYKYIVVDLSRTPSEATSNIARSIQVIGTNGGALAIDIAWYVVYERTVEIDTSTGSLIA